MDWIASINSKVYRIGYEAFSFTAMNAQFLYKILTNERAQKLAVIFGKGLPMVRNVDDLLIGTPRADTRPTVNTKESVLF